MSSWSDMVAGIAAAPAPAPRGRVLRGAAAAGVRGLPLDIDLEVSSAVTADPELVARVTAEAQADGYAAGYAQGLADGHHTTAARDADRSELVDRAVAALDSAAGALQARQALALADVEQAVVATALELVEVLLGRELAVAADPGRDALARALALAPHGVPVVARLHPDDLATMAELGTDAAALAPGRDVTVVADPGVEPAGCVLEAGSCTIDAQLSSAVERIRQAVAS